MEQPLKEKSFSELLKLNYQEICAYYAQKYGHPRKDYFANDSYRTISSNNQKMKEGLFLHHIDEDKVINLGKKEIAQKQPFSYQKKERLIYCNYLERLLLYMKILEDYEMQKKDNIEEIENIIHENIVPELNDIFGNIKFKALAKENIAKAVRNEKHNYLILLNYLIHKLKYNLPLLSTFHGQDGEHSLINNFSIYDEIIGLGLKLENEYQVWTDFFWLVSLYTKKGEKTQPLLDWLWHTFHNQIKQTTNKKIIFQIFLLNITTFYLMEKEPLLWQTTITILFLSNNNKNVKEENRTQWLQGISTKIYKELENQDDWNKKSYEEEKRKSFQYMQELDEKEQEEGNKDYKRTPIEKEMQFVIVLITWWMKYIHNINI